jgi:hypothetical protein
MVCQEIPLRHDWRQYRHPRAQRLETNFRLVNICWYSELMLHCVVLCVQSPSHLVACMARRASTAMRTSLATAPWSSSRTASRSRPSGARRTPRRPPRSARPAARRLPPATARPLMVTPTDRHTRTATHKRPRWPRWRIEPTLTETCKRLHRYFSLCSGVH